MTLYVDEAQLTVPFYLNEPNLDTGSSYQLKITSQYAKTTITLDATLQTTNDRYSKFFVTFPTGFGDEHKNGIYYYSVNKSILEPFTYGLVKIITEPGGGMGTVVYDSGVETENREADVYYRPNYT